VLGRYVQRLKDLAAQIEETRRRADELFAAAKEERAANAAAVSQIVGEIRDARSISSETHGMASHLQTLAGATLSSVNHVDSRGLHLLELSRQALGRIEARQLRLSGCVDWRENEFRVFSQFGEDGLIQLLIREVPISRRFFVEFGVEDYLEANTRFLLLNDRWAGFVLDGSADNVAAIREDMAYQRHALEVQAAFITRENINALLAGSGVSGEIGLLSIDIDGNDYWVWEAITQVEPTIVVVEYNYRFGVQAAVATPYRADFVKDTAHPSGIYYGASLHAFCLLAERKGYVLVGCSSGGVNAFFVRKDRLPATIPAVTVEEGFVAGQHAEMRDSEGRVTKPTLQEQQDLLLTLPLIQITKDNSV
jgi:hypothetical protein